MDWEGSNRAAEITVVIDIELSITPICEMKIIFLREASLAGFRSSANSAVVTVRNAANKIFAASRSSQPPPFAPRRHDVTSRVIRSSWQSRRRYDNIAAVARVVRKRAAAPVVGAGRGLPAIIDSVGPNTVKDE